MPGFPLFLDNKAGPFQATHATCAFIRASDALLTSPYSYISLKLSRNQTSLKIQFVIRLVRNTNDCRRNKFRIAKLYELNEKTNVTVENGLRISYRFTDGVITAFYLAIYRIPLKIYNAKMYRM